MQIESFLIIFFEINFRKVYQNLQIFGILIDSFSILSKATASSR